MGTDIQPPEPPIEGGQVEGAPSAGPPEVPVAAPSPTTGPAAPVVGAATGPPQYQPEQVEQAMGLHRALNDPIGAGEAMTRLVQRHGQLPEWFTWDHAVDAMRNYAQFMSEMDDDDQGGGQQQVAQPQTATGGPPPQDFERALQQHLAPLQQRLEQYEQERQQDEGNRRAEIITGAVESVGDGLGDAARDTLMNNVVYGLRGAMDRGENVDFSPRAIQAYAASMLTHLRSLSLTEQQQQIADHREMAPQTRVPNGSPTAAPVPRGIAGAASRATELARQWEAGNLR